MVNDKQQGHGRQECTWRDKGLALPERVKQGERIEASDDTQANNEAESKEGKVREHKAYLVIVEGSKIREHKEYLVVGGDIVESHCGS